jgi:hypothetical protein
MFWPTSRGITRRPSGPGWQSPPTRRTGPTVSWPRSTMAATWWGDAPHDRPQCGVYRGPRVAWQGGAGRTGGGALPAGPRPSYRHPPATRRPDDEFNIGYRPRRGGVFAGPR